MKSVALLHTVKSVYESFEDFLRAQVGELTVYNLLDDFLAIDANLKGEFTQNNLERLKLDLHACDRTEADLIVVTCSTLSPWIKTVQNEINRPIFTIDDAMTTQAAKSGGRVVVIATAQSALGPVCRAIEEKSASKHIDLVGVLCGEAMTALRTGDKTQHDELITECAKNVKNADLIVLAQASMAHMDEHISRICHCPTLQSPNLCARQVADWLERKYE